MDQVTYADLKLSRKSGLGSSSPPSLPQNTCQGPHGHQFPRKFGYALIIIIVVVVVTLPVIGFSLSVMLRQKPSMEKHVPESRKNTTGIPLLLTCKEPWIQKRKKCLTFSSSSDTWNDSQVHCSEKGSKLLLIQDKNELDEIQMNLNDNGKLFWIGLIFSSSEKKWKWINDSFFISNGLQVYGDATENSCASISNNKIVSENCDAENSFICQKELSLVSSEVFSNS